MIFSAIKDIDYLKIKNYQTHTQFNGCDYSKIYLQSWGFYSSIAIEIAYENDFVFLRFKPNQKYYDEPLKFEYIYLVPLCKVCDMKKAVSMLIKQAKEDKKPLCIMDIPEEYLGEISDFNFKINEDKNYADYLYLPNDLINLPGKKYHSKRNHIKSFDKKYQYEFRSYKEEDRPLVMELIHDWEENKTEGKGLGRDEAFAITKALDLLSTEENAFADVLLVDKKIIGFSLGEITASGVGIVHIEKGNISYDGVYSKINNLVAKKHFSNIRIINRQEDMGMEGLRKSKMSYHPIGFNKKFLAIYN